MQFKSRQADKSREKSDIAPFSATVEYENHHGHGNQSHCRGEAGCKFIYNTSVKQRYACYGPVEERRLVGDFAAIVTWQNPVAILKHSISYHSLAGLAFSMKVCQAKSRDNGNASHYQ